jgi:maleylacetate reductase
VRPAIENFTYVANPARVIFGAGTFSQISAEIELLGARKAIVLCTAEQIAAGERVADALGEQVVGLFPRAVMHVPMDTVYEARELARRLHADCAVAIGGGSTIGLGKAIALESGLPILAIPTTYAGSEMTPIYGLTENRVKRTGKDWRVLPRTVLYDPTLTLSLPVGLTVTSGINAIAHSAEALYARDGNPIMDLIAEEGIRAIAGAIPALKERPDDLEARTAALYGAWLCGTALGSVGMALHHKLCHTLGGSFNLPHADVHTVILPHAIAYNAPAISGALSKLKRALHCDNPASALYDLARSNGAPYSLKDLGMKAADLERAADIAVANPYWNPCPIERAGILELLQHAWEGLRPG